ncbi:MAG: DUF2202 domain-containing protein [Saprospiraceae bacterium]|nr:DUF2202 domain-containing protein [Saprospiraceae bacterium]
MKTTIKSFSMIFLALVAVLSLTQCQKEQDMQEMHNYALNQDYGFGGAGIIPNDSGISGTMDFCECLANSFALQELNEIEKQALLFMREEEKLARDVYQYLFDKWNVPVFNNIQRSEERHMEKMLCLIQRYDLQDPVAENNYGEFADEGLQSLYDALITSGSQNLNDAFTVGATIEDVDINDLITLAEGGDIDNEDILAVFTELTKGSRNHLRAFVKNLEQNGSAYTPQYISQDYYDGVINSDRERGGNICAASAECPNYGSGYDGDCPRDGSGTCTQDCTGRQSTANGTGSGFGNGAKKGPKGGPN